MKKYFVFTLILLLFPFSAFALEKETVEFSSCVDGDTAKFKLNNETIKVRFLAIDTPETKHPTKGEEPYGKEASDFTCDKIKNAKKIELEYDENSDKKDRYDRVLAWVFVDDSLLQSELVKNGLAEVAYLYGDYKYTSLLNDNEEYAKANKLGMYSDTDNSYYTKHKTKEIEDKVNEKAKKKVKKKMKNYFNKIVDKILDEIFN